MNTDKHRFGNKERPGKGDRMTRIYKGKGV
jgi:hypothetical protein